MILELFRERKSVRKYEERPVEDEKIKAVLEAARVAPSWANKQCWQYIVTRDNSIKESVSRVIEGNPAEKAVRQAPVLIVACADPELSGKVEDKGYYLVDIGISFEHICLEARRQGLGTVWIGLFDEKKIRDIFEVPDNIRIVAMTPLGYPAKMPDDRGRKSLDSLVFKDKWGIKQDFL